MGDNLGKSVGGVVELVEERLVAGKIVDIAASGYGYRELVVEATSVQVH